MTDSQRIEEIKKYVNLSANALSKEIGLKNPQIFYDIKAGKCGISKDLASKIKERFFNFDFTWILTGSGNMLESDNRMTSIDYGDVKMIPLLPMAAQGGSLNDFIVSVKPDDCEKIISPIKGAEFAMTVSGDSMEPEYPSGAKILLKRINERAFIEWGRVYVLDTCNGSVIKIIMPGPSAEAVTCVSLNEHYPPFEVAFGDMYGMYRVLMLLSEK